MGKKNTKANNFSIFIDLFRYIPSDEKDGSFSLLALIPLLWHCVKWPGAKDIFRKNVSTECSIF